MLPAILFYLFTALALLGALLTAFAANPRRAAPAGLALAMPALAAIFLLLNAQFLAAVQLLVWVGPTIILFLLGFSIIKPKPRPAIPKGQILALSALVAAVIVVLAWLFIRMPWQAAPSPLPTSPNLEQLAAALLSAHAPTAYLIVFELLSLLILIVMVGGAYLATPHRPTPPETTTIETLSPSIAAREKSKR